MKRVWSFAPNKLVSMYLDRIGKDLKITSPSALMNKLIADYFVMQYGEDVRKEVRKEFIDKEFGDY